MPILTNYLYINMLILSQSQMDAIIT